ncbi:MAG: tetratricopeptide repeat protein [Deltaproteobacteria bacterium]|nr:tetratricopeptide repeat protein [Deltaproteobacteria bacterium]
MRAFAGSALVALVLLSGGACASSAADRKPDTFQARKSLTRELVARQSFREAFFYADEMHRERPKDAEVLMLRGIVYREQGMKVEAETDLREALQRAPKLAEAHAALGVLLDGTGRGAEAGEHHEKANALAPDNPAYLNNLGFSLFLRGKHREAITSYHRAARLDPTNRRIRTNLGFAYAAAGDWPRAAHEFDTGSASKAQAKNNLGFAYERRGDLGTAYGLYVEALRLDPSCAQARANLLAIAERMGKPLPEDLAAAVVGGEERKQP